MAHAQRDRSSLERLARRVRRTLLPARDANGERGGTMVIVTVILPVVLFGMGAMVLDIGATAQERAELRNGADAAVLAVVNDCLKNPNCDDVQDTARAFARANASDGEATVEEICGTVGGLSACTNPAVSLPTNAKGYLRVKVKTKDKASGSDKLTYTFGRVLGMSGVTVRQRSTMIWGPPAAGSVVPLIFSKCEYLRAIAGGPLPSGPPFSGSAQIIYFHGSTQAGTCPQGPSGYDLPGGFGWLQNSGCSAIVNAPAWVSDKTGNGVPNGCDPTTWQNKSMLIPIYDNVTGTGGNGQYYAIGFATIYITGYRFPSGEWPAGYQCPAQPGNSGVCIRGYFQKNNQTNSNQFGSGDFGSMVVKFVG